jgi:HD superfamily phosphodiesterase
MKIIQIAAILHDIGIKESERKYNSSSGKYQEMEGPAIAKEILKNFNLEESLTERVCFLIGNHHTYNKIDDIDFQILVESDFIINIFEDNIQKEQVKNIKDKYFKTKTGTNYLENMYISLECDCDNE